MTLLQVLHVMAATLSPLAPHIYQADLVMLEIAHIVGESKAPPVFASKEEDAAVMLVTAWEESRFTAAAVGDHGRALCAYQLQRAPRAVLTSMWLCTTIAYARLRASVKACPGAPLSPYVGGGCASAVGQEMSEKRIELAAMLLEATHEN